MRTKDIGNQFIELASTESTNKSAAELISLSKLRHGAVILAHDQTTGRGQRDRVWQSSPGLDLTFSIAVQPTGLRVEEQFVISKMIALAVHHVVQKVLKRDVRIKWPNDILVDRRKVAGILIQNELQGDKVGWSIIGVGLNVNSRGFEEYLLATSLSMEAGRNFDRMEILEAICLRLEELWEKWKNGERGIAEEYADQLWSKGRWAYVELDGKQTQVRPMEVDHTGRLLVEHDDGRVGAYGSDGLRFAPR
ncbi:MAG: biotin--[acetyl-CoA-carboxylase] ligase [Flavobacteriales bacterium]|nr:biotin--[acetyl-CoA-carboxylase] ligase [Flavobacteriales bacterium]